MGGMGSKVDCQQVLIVGLERSGKSLFLKKLMDMKKQESEDFSIQTTLGYNYVTIDYHDITFDVWELGGDFVSRQFWPSFYRNLKFSIVIFMINLFDNDHNETLKELLILVNQEELKQARFFIIFNLLSDETKKISFNDPSIIKENRETAENLLADLRECPIHDYDSRIYWDIIDISKMKAGENKTDELLKKVLGTQKEKIIS